ncbi:MAG: 2OG-Fe(II) oxygenase [Rhodoferax sp.]
MSPDPQHVTPELREWMMAQAAAGQPPQAMIESMVASGWHEDVALVSLHKVLNEHLAAKAARAEQDRLPPAVPVPEPALQDSPLYLDAGDRRVHVLQTMLDPRVVVFGNLLGDDECDALIALARPRMARSLTVATDERGEAPSDDRTSSGMFFERGENELVARVEARIARLVNWPVENGEGLQILRYAPGAQYRPHYDYFDPHEPGTTAILRRGGQRVATLIIYLCEPDQGGGTTFPNVHLEIAPKRGNAVFFSYERPDPSTFTLHGGAPVIAGEKWIATKWLREREFI